LQSEGLSQRQACRIVRCPRPTMQYRSRRRDRDRPVRDRLRELAAQRLRAGWRTLKIFLRREGIVMNDKRLRRIYREEQLQVKPRRRRRVRLARGPVAPPPTRLNDEWGLDYMEDRLWTRRKIRALTVEDRFSREGLALDIDFSLTGRRVTRALDDIALVRGYPRRLRIDNGPENCSRAMLDWSIDHEVELHFIDPGKPAQNAWIESFNARVRDEFFNLRLFRTLDDARRAATLWLTDYNHVRPHSSLGYKTPAEFAATLSTFSTESTAATTATATPQLFLA
jgi:putative transposase